MLLNPPVYPPRGKRQWQALASRRQGSRGATEAVGTRGEPPGPMVDLLTLENIPIHSIQDILSKVEMISFACEDSGHSCHVIQQRS